MRLADAEHAARPWRIHELTRDFRLEDAWALPTPGGREDFPRLVELVAAFDPFRSSSPAVRALFAIRGRAGELLGWDEGEAAAEGGGPTLRDRLPADLRDGPAGPSFEAVPFTPLYLTADEWAIENVNRTVHGVLHFGWAPAPQGGYRGEMAVYVKRNGLLGSAYMAAISPFRHRVVYPRILAEIEREWASRRSR